MAYLRESVAYWFDKKYVRAVYRYIFHRELHWKNPTRFTEKLHIFKISPESEKVGRYADKFAVREYVKRVIGEQYLIPLIGVYDSVDEIDLEKLPESFVLKATHGSGWNILCADKKELDWSEAKKKLGSWLHSNFYKQTLERQYKNIPPRIVCEELLYEHEGGLTEYKIFCFGGKPECVRLQAGRAKVIHKSYYDLDWKKMPLVVVRTPPTPQADLPKPKHFEKMLELAAKLSAPFPYVRVDLYNINGKIYFSELTFTPNNGQDIYDPDFYDELFGSKYDLEAWKLLSG